MSSEDPIRKVMLDSRERMAYLDSEISRTKSILTSLTEERNIIFATLDRCGPSLSPIHKMPTELLSEVFTSCLAEDLENRWMAADNAGSVPLLLSGICRRWRIIAMSMP